MSVSHYCLYVLKTYILWNATVNLSSLQWQRVNFDNVFYVSYLMRPFMNSLVLQYNILLTPFGVGEHSYIDWLCLVDAHTVNQNQYTGKHLTIFTFFVMALCHVQKYELSYNVLGMTQNCIPPIEIVIPNRECVIRLGIGEGANVIFKQVSHTIR